MEEYCRALRQLVSVCLVSQVQRNLFELIVCMGGSGKLTENKAKRLCVLVCLCGARQCQSDAPFCAAINLVARYSIDQKP